MLKNTLKGQIGLLLLVIMGVVVALVMSVASRSLSDTVMSRQDRESSAAFAVAETGIEQAMKSLGQGEVPTGVIGIPPRLDIVSGQYKVSQNTSYGLFVEEGQAAHLDVSDFSGDLNIFWTKRSDNSENVSSCIEGSGNAPAAIEVSMMSGSTVTRQYFNPNIAGMMSCDLGGNGFSSDTLDGGATYLSNTTINIQDPTLTVRIKPIYSGATIEVNGANLKNQLYLIQSRAVGGDAQKEIEVKRGLNAPPSIFDFAVFSNETIVK